MKRSTLYWYYPDLGEVFDAAVERTTAELQVHLAERVGGIEHPLDLLAGLVDAFAEFHRERPAELIRLFQLWAVSRSSEPQRVLERGRRFLQPLRDMLMAAVQAGIDGGLVQPCDPAWLVDMTLAVIDGSQVQRLTRSADLEPLFCAYRSWILEPLRGDEK